MADWSNLPYDLLILIAKRIHYFEDFISFGEVCTSWRSAATKKNYTNKFPQIPWLMITTRKKRKMTQTFCSLKKGILHKVILPNRPLKLLLLSSQGWFLGHKHPIDMYLLHPFSRARIPLPSGTTLPYDYTYSGHGYPLFDITRFCLSHSPSLTSDYWVMLSFGFWEFIAICRPGDARYTFITRLRARIYDIAYHENKLYGVDNAGRVFLCAINGTNPTDVSFVMNLKKVVQKLGRLFILELEGKLVVVSRILEDGNIRVRVFEMNLVEETWFEMKDIGDTAIFLGRNSSFSVEASFSNGCKGNCIYFAKDFFDKAEFSHHWAQNQVGYVYNMFDGSIEAKWFDTTASDTFSETIASGTWFEPSF